MALLVVKFGGTSVGNIDRIKYAAGKVAQEVKRGHKIVVVVSAMAGVTDTLIGYCRSVNPRPNPREYDSIVSTGEQVSSGLLALALEQRGLNARSWLGWQLPIRTDTSYTKATIRDIDVTRLEKRLERGEVAVLAGFQGVADDLSITTLGRGGSDTSAVALAAALGADRCDIYTDVDGIYTADPHIVARATKLSRVSYEEMLELAALGAKVLQTRAVEMGLRYHVPIQVLSTFENAIGSDLPGTLVTTEDQIMENNPVTGIAHSLAEGKLTLVNLPDRPGVASLIFSDLARTGINVGTIVQTASGNGTTTDVTLTVSRDDLNRAAEILKEDEKKIGFTDIQTDKQIAKVSIVGLGMRTHPGVAATMFETLFAKGINIQAIETSEINVSVLIAEEYLELALRALHTAFGLDQVSP